MLSYIITYYDLILCYMLHLLFAVVKQPKWASLSNARLPEHRVTGVLFYTTG